MYLEYNGVTLELLTLDQVSREAVYSADGQDLMYIKWLVGATCVYAPGGRPVGVAATNLSRSTLNDLYRRPPGADLRGNPPDFPGWNQVESTADGARAASHAGFLTDAELKTRLWMPRKKLVIWTFSRDGKRVAWLESPKPGLTCDVAGGPKPIAVDVVRVAGDGLSLGIHFQIMTMLTPCPNGSDRLILSHRWEMEHTHDEDQYLSRIIRGEVVFNQALVNANSFNPDWVRSQFIHPIPLGMKRHAPTVTQSSDGTTIRYEVVDVDTSITFDAGDSGATNIEIIENVQYIQPWRVV